MQEWTLLLKIKNKKINFSIFLRNCWKINIFTLKLIKLTWNPSPHLHAKEPLVFVHEALFEQLSAPIAHSSTSLQVTPFPWNPDLQSQPKDPGKLVQSEFTEHTLLPVRHSSISLHWTPFPWNPEVQLQKKPSSVSIQIA